MALLVASIVFAAELTLIALSFSLSYGILGFPNFAHSEFVTISALAAFALSRVMPVPVAAALAAVMSGVVALSLDMVVFRKLEGARVSTQMIVTMGLGIAIRAISQLFWGVKPRMFSWSRGVFSVAGVSISEIQVVVIAVAASAVVLLHFLLKRTHFGRCLRATADSRSLAELRGLNTRKTLSQTWLLAGTLAGLGGVLLGIETFVRPQLGETIMLPMFAAALVGGFGSPYGAIVGALLLSLGQTAIVSIDFGALLGGESMFVGSQYKSAFAFAIMIITLLVRPGGFFGKEEERV